MNLGIAKKNIIAMCVLFLLPAAALYALFFIYPAANAFYISLFDWNGFSSGMKFIGLRNFQELLADTRFWGVAVKNTMKFILFGGVFIFALSFLFSGILTTRTRGKKFYRAVLFFPNVINPIAICILWGFIYNKQWGLLTNLVKLTGISTFQPTWTSPENIFWAILAMMVWTYTGFYCVILLSALDQVPPDLIESASLEGANEAAIFFKVKLPLIWDVLVVAITLWGIAGIKEFSLIFAWGGGLDIPQDGYLNLATNMYINAFGKRIGIYRMGYSTAMGIVMFLAVVVTVLLISRIGKRDTIEY